MNVKKFSSRFLVVLAVAMLAFAGTSCSNTETTDSTAFTIYYSGMTDIGPSMNGIIASPTYKGSAPHSFAITQVTLKDKPFTGSCFTINSESGSISIDNTAGIAVGLYRISVSCISGGSTHEFKNAIEVNMMPPVPAGITVEPNRLKVDYADVTGDNSETKLPTAQVKTDGNHVSIRKYEIAESTTSKFFAISQTGEISIIKGSKEITPGIYPLSLKLTTGASGKDEGIFENAVEINVTSKPLLLTYTPAEGKIEEETEGGTTFTSTIPMMKGSAEGVVYRIKNITPATDKIKIDEKIGVLSVATGHKFKAGEKYIVDVNVVNEHTQEGVDFNGTFTLEAVAFIEPIENFSYENAEKTQANAFNIKLSDQFKGGEVKYEFVDLNPALEGQLTIDHEGTILAKKGNTIKLGTYTITVKAFNSKGDKTATFQLLIQENPNYFTRILYGNNLPGLTPAENYANQYRVTSINDLVNLSITPTINTKKPNVKAVWSLKIIQSIAKDKEQDQATQPTPKIDINSATGEITHTTGYIPTQCIWMVEITATTGKGTEDEVTVITPVFFQYSIPVKGVTVEYNPFVFKVNSKNGGKSVSPQVQGAGALTNFALDYRRSFNYYSFNSIHEDGTPADIGSFLYYGWAKYWGQEGKSTGDKSPLSYFKNYYNKNTLLEIDKLDTALAYVDNKAKTPDASDRFSVIVNGNKWSHNAENANGVLFGQMTFTTFAAPLPGSFNETTLNNGSALSPIVIWFDEKY